MFKRNKLKIITLVISIAVVFLTLFISEIICTYSCEPACSNSCSYGVTEGLLEPLLSLSAAFSLLVMFMFVFSERDFKKWLLYIVSWYLPISIIIISQISIYSSHVMSIDRGPAALWLMGGLFVLTLIFGLVGKLIKKKSHSPVA